MSSESSEAIFAPALAIHKAFPESKEPEAVLALRTELLSRQQSALRHIAGSFIGFLSKHWKESSVILFALFSVIGFIYAKNFYAPYGIDIAAYLQGVEDLAFIGFLKGEVPLAITLLTAIWLVAIHIGAEWAGSGSRNGRSATPFWTGFFIFANHPVSIAIVVLVALAQMLNPGLLLGRAYAQGETKKNALVMKVDDGKPIEITGILGSTANYLFVELQQLSESSASRNAALAVARDRVHCIGPKREIDSKSLSGNYGVPPCDVVLQLETEKSPEVTAKSGFRAEIAHELGCDIDAGSPWIRETSEFEHGQANFSCPGGGHTCEQASVRQSVASELSKFLAQTRSSPRESAAFIIGFASEPGMPAYNLNLSEQRAQVVRSLVGAWPTATNVVAAGEGRWTRALDSESGRTVMVVVCEQRPSRNVLVMR